MDNEITHAQIYFTTNKFNIISKIEYQYIGVTV